MKNSRIAEERKKLGLSQEELANRLKISQKSISKYECGSRRPSYEVLLAMASLFGVTTDYLLGNNSYTQTPDQIQNNYDEFFFFDDLLKDVFMSRLKRAIFDNGITEEEFLKQVSFEEEKGKKYLAGECEPSLEDLIEISQLLNTSVDYLLGQIPQLSTSEKKLLNAFSKLDDDLQDIVIGKAKEFLREQELNSVAADEQLKRTGTETTGK